MKHRIAWQGIALALVAVTASAEEPRKSPGERAVEYRQSVFTVLANNYGPVHMAADGKAPFNAADVQKRSERVAQIAKFLDDAFPDISNGAGQTEAKPEIWKNTADFQKQERLLVERSDALAVAAKTGDQAKVKAAADELGKSCHDCHEQFKKK